MVERKDLWVRCDKCKKWLKSPIKLKEEKKCNCGGNKNVRSERC